MPTHVTWGHDEGKGACRNVSSGENYSCETCFQADCGSSRHGSGNRVLATCSICNGTGWIKTNN